MVFLLFIGMWSWSPGQAQENNRAGFMEFVAEFVRNDSTQREYMHFPLVYCEWQPGMDSETPDTTYISEADWRPLRLHPLPHGGEMESDGGTYAQWYVVEETQTTIEIRGVDNGLHTNLVFYRYGGRWMLVRIEEYST